MERGESEAPLSVSQAVELVKGTVDSIPQIVVNGEVSGFRGPNARSGHCYFTIKDDSSAMDVIVWRGTYARCGFRLRDGLEVTFTGRFGVYAGTGRLSFIASRLEVAGEGLLRQQVAALARKLEAEGLMDPARKRHIPRFCVRVAVVTSLSGSVIEDVKRTLARRNPLVQIQVVGCMVQGPGAPQTIIRALGVAAAARPDAILLVRGGGSFEDLMTFNDEALARAVAACPVPVITGIGHEPDTSICDMVADRRCSTPTAAAESVAPAFDEVEGKISERAERLGKAMGKQLSGEVQRLDTLALLATNSVRESIRRRAVAVEAMGTRRCLSDPRGMLLDREAQLEQTGQRLHDAIPRTLQRRGEMLATDASRLSTAARRMLVPFHAEVTRSAATLDALSPLKVLGRGYAVASDVNGHVVDTVGKVSPGDAIGVLVSDGIIQAEVTGVSRDEKTGASPREA